jgi:predicted RNase H-like HicB family nuclease
MDKREILEKEAENHDLELGEVIGDMDKIELKTNKQAVEEMKEEGVLEEDYEPKYDGYCIEYRFDNDEVVATQGESVEEAYEMLFEAVALYKGLIGKEVEDLDEVLDN